MSAPDALAQRLLDAVAGGTAVPDLARWASRTRSSTTTTYTTDTSTTTDDDKNKNTVDTSIPYDDALVGAAKRLERLGCIQGKWEAQQLILCTDSGAEAKALGSPEGRLIKALREHIFKKSSSGSKVVGVPRADVEKVAAEAGISPDLVKVGFAQAMRQRLVALDKKSQVVTVLVGDKDNNSASSSSSSFVDTVQEQLQKLDSLDAQAVDALKKRKLVAVKQVTVFCDVKQGPAYVRYVADLPVQLTDLTEQALLSGTWEKSQFKPFNFNALGQPPVGGSLHPLLKVRAEFREVFLEMGFEEMPTNNFVESSFWNFDTLFQPQQHPARDAHDTFFLSAPAHAKLTEDPAYVQRVKKMHEQGGAGSIGWRYDWSLEESSKNILRTHTTAVSSRMLYNLAKQEGGFRPVKYFSIDRVFRNEAVDATHLAEFHQIEGLVADYDLTLGNLMGIIQQFFNRLGIKNLRFKPAYNPYTEPSMEVFSYHEGLKKWVEIGNSGVFRPEMLQPMGLPENVRVIAWGLSLERPTMIKYGISNIRDLVGHKISLEFIKHNPMCRLDQVDN